MEVAEHPSHTITVTVSYPEGEPANVIFDLGMPGSFSLRADHNRFEARVYEHMEDIGGLILRSVKAHEVHPPQEKTG